MNINLKAAAIAQRWNDMIDAIAMYLYPDDEEARDAWIERSEDDVDEAIEGLR